MENRTIAVVTTSHSPDDQRITKEISTFLKWNNTRVIYIAPEGDPRMQVEYIPLPKPHSRKDRFLKLPKIAYKKIINLSPDFVHFHDPEFIPYGVKLAKKGIKVIYDVHEDYPNVVLMREWIPSIFKKIISKSFKIVEEKSSFLFFGVVTVTEDLCKRFSKFTKCALVPNYPNIRNLRYIKRQARNDGIVRYTYIGALIENRSICEIIEAYSMLRRKYPYTELWMVGPIGVKYIKECVDRATAIPGFKYISPVPFQEAMEILAKSDVGLLVYKRFPGVVISSPNKMFEYLYFNLPIVASNFEYWKRIIDERCAVFVEPEDPISIMKGMEKAMNLVGKVNCSDILKEYTWNKCEKNLKELYSVKIK